MLRRDFLRAMGFVSASAALSQLGWMQAHAAPADYKALVCVFLFGGNDGNNTIVPIDARYDAYAQMRGSLALTKESLFALPDASATLQLGVHPGLKTLKGAWSAGHLGLVLNTGPLVRPITRADLLGGASRPQGLFSHSDQQRLWQTATRNGTLGWGGRVADEFSNLNAGAKTPGMIAIARDAQFTNARSGSLVLPTTGGLTLRGSDSSPESRARHAAIEQMLTVDKNFELVAAAQEVTSGVLERRAAVNSIVNAKSASVTAAFKGLTSTVSKQLATIAKVIERNQELGVKRQIFFVGLGGFDTHSGQLATQNTLLTQLGSALKAFYDSTTAMGISDRVTTFTLSDFARTMRVNTAGGTDHAWGNHHLVLGGAVRGGTAYGELPTFAAGGVSDASGDGRWIPTTSVDQYAATLARWFGVEDARLNALFPNLANFTTPDVGFMQ